MSDVRRRWYLEPKVVLPIVAATIIIAVLFAPQAPNSRGGDARLTTYSRSAQGARLLHDLAAHTGFEVSRSTDGRFPTDTNVTYAVLAPPVPLRTRDAHALLEHVRAGGGALVVLGGGTAQLADSLGVNELPGQRLVATSGIISSPCPEPRHKSYSLWLGGAAYLTGVSFNRSKARPANNDFRDHPTLTDTIVWEGLSTPTDTFVTIEAPAGAGRRRSRVSPAMIGVRLGAGRMVLATDPDVLRNDALRECGLNLDVAAVRALEYLRAGNGSDASRRKRIIFDEYHQGVGANGGSMRAISYFLGSTAPGHMVLQLTAAGLVLIGAATPRMLPPAREETLQRRSVDEHVEALARAYQQVHATQTATRRLVQGLRRRTRHGGSRTSGRWSDDQFLEELKTKYSALDDRVALLRRALAGHATVDELPTVANAIAEIEGSMKHTPTSGFKDEHRAG